MELRAAEALAARHIGELGAAELAGRADQHVDPRTLRRQLAAEGTTFKAITDEIREALAVELLTAGGLSLEQVASRLGYHDAAGFSRAFRRWTGATPGTYRARFA